METFIEIQDDFTGSVPDGYELVVVEQGRAKKGDYSKAIVLYGFDEIGIFDSNFDKPTHGFLLTT